VHLTEIALAVGTLLLAAFALWQVLISRRTARQQLRAYVIFEGGSIPLQQLQGQTFFEAYVRLKNFGQTPAYNHSSWVRIEVQDASQPPFAPGNGLTKDILAPAGESNLPVHCGPITAQDLNDIRNERKRIFVWGGADYTDIFEANWHYEFRCWNEKEMPNRPNQWGLVPADNPDQEKNMSEKSFLKRWGVPIFTAVVAGATVVQAWAFITSERAFVTVSDVHFAKDLTPGLNPLPIFFEMKNAGKSTATVDVLKANITHGPLAAIPDYKDSPQFAIAPIVPNDTSQRILDFETAWGQETNDKVKTGSLPLFIYGVIQYRDDLNSSLSWFVPRRETGFCFIYKPTGGVRERIFETCKESAYTYTR